VSHDLHPHLLKRVQLHGLRPTQVSVGEFEVELKREEWTQLSKRERRKRLDDYVFPSVLGPKQEVYIVDHHHLGLALLREEIDEVWISVLDELSWLTKNTFWRVMEFRAWTHPYDQHGVRLEYANMPKTLLDMRDDPFRSLAALVRTAGGFSKTQAPFAEFLWADFFRSQLDATKVKRDVRAAVQPALKLARRSDARYLPGWAGQHDRPT
jgi:hypothetical protein